jgi:hypothetical protein
MAVMENGVGHDRKDIAIAEQRWVVGGADPDNLNQKHKNTIQNAKTCPVCDTCIRISGEA